MFKASTQNRNGSTRNYFQYSSKKQMRLIIDWRLIFYIYVVFSFPQMSYDFGETELLSEIYYIRSSCQLWQLFYLSVHQIWHLLCLPAIPPISCPTLELLYLAAVLASLASTDHAVRNGEWVLKSACAVRNNRNINLRAKSTLHMADICRPKCRSVAQTVNN